MFSTLYVYDQLVKFEEEYELSQDDELWLVIDKDKWPSKMLAEIGRLCNQKQHFHLAVSCPCFELWLILHVEDVSKLNNTDLNAMLQNKRGSKHADTWTKQHLRHLLGSYHENEYDADALLAHLHEARDRAACMDRTNTQLRWPIGLGTHVYKLIDSIFRDDWLHNRP